MKIIVFVILHSAWDCFIADSCRTPENEVGNCVLLDHCPKVSSLVSPNMTSEERIYLSKSQCGVFDGEQKVCCLPESTRDERRLNILTGKLPTGFQCSSHISNRILGGEITKINDFPFMALLKYSKPHGRWGLNCGGALINAEYVLTAGHCCSGMPNGWKLTHVRLGEWDTSSTQDCDFTVDRLVCSTPHKDIEVYDPIVHENFDLDNLHNDIAVLHLKERVLFNLFIQPICLPITSRSNSLNLVNKSMFVVGWGKTEKTNESKIKQVVTVRGVFLTQCRKKYRKRNIQPSQICAGGEAGKDSCTGDSGGPLFIYDNVTDVQNPYWLLVGIVSYGPKECGTQGYPGVYTKAANYIGWISKNIT